MWLENDSDRFSSLFKRPAQGGWHLQGGAEQWRKLVEMAGGWTSEGEEDLEDEIAEAVQRIRARTGGQGFSLSPEVRKAVEKRAREIAQKHFEGMGDTVTVKASL